MTTICLYFKAHQPYRFNKYQSEDITISGCYENAIADEENINRMADQCYLPANEILYEQISRHNNQFSVSFSLSGTTLELLMKYRPDTLQSFRKLASTGCVEFLAETYYHSLSSLHSRSELQRQVQKHSELITRLFGTCPSVFRNTELIHNNTIAQDIERMGLKGILCEGAERILQGRTPNQVYALPCSQFPLLLRNAVLSDDIAFRFNDPNWTEHPLTAQKFASWIHSHPVNTEVINLFMDYETFGIHKKKETGIFDFLSELPAVVLSNDRFRFSTASEVLEDHSPKDIYNVPQTISWEDSSDESYRWCENVMQNNTLKKIYSIETMVLQCRLEQSVDIWGRLQSADHFYYMAEKSDKKEAVKYLNPFTTPREAFQNYTNLVADFEISLIKQEVKQYKKYPVSKAFINTLY